MCSTNNNREWYEPKGLNTGIYVRNSLTGETNEFITQEGRTVRWYTCGPTVYAPSHLGHARTYVTFDIMRRLMEDYFELDVDLCMNITDLDDKIIITAQNNNTDIYGICRPFETEFFEDMEALNVRPPNTITRVTEYMDEIIAFVQRIVDNGFGYVAPSGSVYFDIQAFVQKHKYAKNRPDAAADLSLLMEGEGAITQKEGGQTEKRSPYDFALWKASKPGEPKWAAPWGGEGRPGWHIECSAMASEILGQTMDIHTGGSDLRFPHHDNELAQSEAAFNSHQWVNYFLHAGHLNIDGLKMSKSLKNFTSIRQMLEAFSAEHIRMLFLLAAFDAVIDYSDSSMQEAVSVLRSYNEFFHEVDIALREYTKLCVGKDLPTQKWNTEDFELQKLFDYTRNEVDACFRNSFDWATPVKNLLPALIKATNTYISSKADDMTTLKAALITNVARWISHILRCLGLSSIPEVGISTSSAEDKSDEVIDLLCDFRRDIRTLCQDAMKTNPELAASILKACDSLRDENLPKMGIRFEDKGENARWKREDPEVLMREISREKMMAEEKAAAKEAARALRAKKDAERLEKMKINPAEMFKTDEYSQWNEEGIPTHDASGEELPKSALKKLVKAHTAQKKLYEEYLSTQAK